MGFAEFYDYTSSYPEEGKNEEVAKGEEEIDITQLDDAGYQLTLPSGATIGHRSLMRYYRQNLTNDRALVPHKMNTRVQSHYKTFGWVGLSKPEAKMKARDGSSCEKFSKNYGCGLACKETTR